MKFGVQLFEASGQYSTLAPEVCYQDLEEDFFRSNDATATRTSKNDRFRRQNNSFTRASRFFEHFFAVFGRLRREHT